MRVRCNWCGEEFDEEDIDTDFMSDEEYCPKCGAHGCLMDLPQTDEDYKEIGQIKKED